MIRLPRRSVTRFFIPLIDVLLLLFSTFLLLPRIKASAEAAPNSPEQRRIRELNDQVARLEGELDRLKEVGGHTPERVKLLQDQFAIRRLEIDNKGNLLAIDPQTGERKPIVSKQAAQTLIEKDRVHLPSGKRDLYYLILYPPGGSSHPTDVELKQFNDWLKDVPHAYDDGSGTVSEGAAERGGKP